MVTIAISPPVFARTSNAILFSRSTVPGSRMPAASTTTSAADVPYPRGAGGNSSCWETAVSRLTANCRNNAFLAGIEIRRGLMCALECRNTTSFSHLSLRQDSTTNQLNRCFEMTRTLAIGSLALALTLGLNGCSKPEVSEGDCESGGTRGRCRRLRIPRVAIADTARIQGNPAAKVWLVMASDFQCPACKHWHDTYAAEIMRDYVASGKSPFRVHQLSARSAHERATRVRGRDVRRRAGKVLGSPRPPLRDAGRVGADRRSRAVLPTDRDRSGPGYRCLEQVPG